MLPVRRSPALIAWLLVSHLAGGSVADAIVFPEMLAYEEDYLGESAFPTAPETDLLLAGGLFANGVTPPLLDGTSAGVSLPFGVLIQAVSLEVGTQSISTGGSGVGVRGGFQGISLTGDGSAAIGVSVDFVPDDTGVTGSLTVERSVSGESALLQVFKREGGVISQEFVSVVIDPALASQALSGAPCSIDLQIDRLAQTAAVSIAIGVNAEVVSPPLALPTLGNQSLASANQAGFTPNPASAPSLFEVDLTLLQVYADPVPHVFEPLFNIDVHGALGSPSNGYAAAGSSGVWNTLQFFSNQLVDVSGTTVMAAADLLASIPIQEAGGSGDAVALMGDGVRDSAGWSVNFTGLLTDGAYRVRVYSAGTNLSDSGTLQANDQAYPAIAGAPVPDLVEGESYASIDTFVTDGVLTVSGTADTMWASVNGLQIERAVPEPALGTGLAAGILWFGMLRSFRRRRGLPASRPI